MSRRLVARMMRCECYHSSPPDCYSTRDYEIENENENEDGRSWVALIGNLEPWNGKFMHMALGVMG